MRFASKAQLVEHIEREHDRFLDLLASVPPSGRLDAGAWGDGWSVKDLVAHLTGWHLLFLRWHREGRGGGRPALPAPGYKWNQLRDLNTAIWLKHRGTSHAQVMREFGRSYRSVLNLVRRLPEARLLTPGSFPWTGKYPLTTYLAPNTCSHYRFATRILKRRLKASAPAGGRRRGSRHR